MLSLFQKVAYSIPNFAMNFSGILISTWIIYFYRPPQEAESGDVINLGSTIGVIMFFGQFLGAIIDPVIGHASDRTRTRLGRRLPYMIFGTPLLAFSFGALWFPPFEALSSANEIFFAAVYCLYLAAFSIVVAPYLSLLPEIAAGDKERVVLSSVMAVFTVLGLIAGALFPSLLGDSFKNGGEIFGLRFHDVYQFSAIIATILLFVMFLIPLINIRETPDSKEKAVPPGLMKAIASTFRNPSFPTYIGVAALTLMGIGLLQASLPFICTQVLERPKGVPGIIEAGAGKEWVGYLLGAIFILSVLFVPLITKLAEKMSKKRLLVYSGIFFGVLLLSLGSLPLWKDPAVPAIIAFILMPFPVCAALVLPNAIYADVVDYDEKLTGFRREGLYNGATSIIVKLAQGLPPVILVLLLSFGDSRSNPTGILLAAPAAGILILLGAWIFSRHPIEK